MARLMLGAEGIARMAITLAMGLAACKQPFPLFCEDHGDCADHPDRPFCDTTGAYTEDGRGKICIAEPFDGGPAVDAASVDGGHSHLAGAGTGGVHRLVPRRALVEADLALAVHIGG